MTTGIQTLQDYHFEPSRLHSERQPLHFEFLKLLIFYLYADPDPTFQSNLDPDPASQNTVMQIHAVLDPQPWLRAIWNTVVMLLAKKV